MSQRNTNQNELDTLLGKLRPFQKEGFEFATSQKEGRNGRILLADEMGLGKTVTSLAIMLAYQHEWPLLILCPASLRYTWPAEIETFYPTIPHSAIYVVKGFDDCDFLSNVQKKSRIQIVVATYSLLQNRSAAARVLQQFQFKCIIADESHNLKEKSSQRCKIAMPILKNAKRLLLLSGTPALAKPVELWSQLHCLNPDLFGSYSYYTKRYCDARRDRFSWNVSGLSNADELHEKLATVMVRRLKINVLKDLPPKQRSIVPVNIQNKAYVKKCEKIISELKEKRVSVQSLIGDEAATAHFEARSLLMQAYQASGTAKAESVCAYVVDFLKGCGSQKVLIFAHHLEVLDKIEAALSKYFKGIGHIRIDGSVPSEQRAARVKMFQNKPIIKVALLSITAAGVGLTLTKASTVIFAELHWTPSLLAQCEDRTHRIGQVNSVHIIYCICKQQELSIDLSLWAMIGRKVNNLGRIIDGKKKTSLNAGDLENTTSENQLSAFFAENSPDNKINTIGSSAPVVKGSIQSFFAKMGNKQSPIVSKASETSHGRDKYFQDSSSKSTQLSLSNYQIEQNSTLDESMWTCSACTFLNNQGSKICYICETSRTKDVTIVDLSQDDDDNALISTVNTPKPEFVDLSNENGNGERAKFSSIHRTNRTSSISRSCDNDVEHTLIRFSVSQNSGRVAIFDDQNISLSVNFDIDDVITEATSEAILLKRTLSQQRKSACIPVLKATFDDSNIKKVVNKLSPIYFSSKYYSQLCHEVKYFVKSFIHLREVEKKTIKEYETPIQSNAIHDTLKACLLESAFVSQSSLTDDRDCYERFSGGAKERAVEKKKLGEVLSQQETDVLNGIACSWCGKPKPAISLQRHKSDGIQSIYCSQECAEEGRLKRGGMYASTHVRQQLFTLERGICQLCHVDCHAFFLRIQALPPGAQRLNALINANWHLPKSSNKSSLDRMIQHQPREGDYWQADHWKPVSEGGGNCGLSNYRTLCTPCHYQETQKLKHRLRLSTSLVSTTTTAKSTSIVTPNHHTNSNNEKKRKMDLRDFFSSPPTYNAAAAVASSMKRKRNT